MADTAKASGGRKVWKIILTVFCIIVGVVLLFILGVREYFRLPVMGYYRNSEKTFTIPGLSDGMIVQGLAYDSVSKEFLVTGYRSDGQPSQVSVIDKETNKETKRLWLADKDGRDFTGHVGGITVAGDYIYVADGDGLMVYTRKSFADAKDGDKVNSVGLFETKTEDDSMRVAFVHAEGDTIYLGEFYREKNYPTPDSHKYTTKAGDANTALIIAYKLDSTAELGISDRIEFAYSTPGLVQGMCFDADGRIYLSTSYAVAFSHIYRYKNPAQEGDIEVLGQTVPLYVLDSSSLDCDIKLPPMSEEIVVVDGKLYTMCESATNKYIFGKFTSASHCYATDISKYE